MPPRGARVARSSRGGRGRGRGASRADPAATTSSVNEEIHPNEASQAQSAGGDDAAMQDAPAQETSVDSPVMSDIPADQPSSRPSRTPSATPSRVGGRFRPKNVRRDAVERARLEEERNRDLATKLKAEADELRAEERRARRGRGRGDRGQRGLIRRTVTASGPFSSVAQANTKAARGGWGWSAGGGGGAGEVEIGSSSKSGPTTAQNGDDEAKRYRPRPEHENRVNIDKLNGITGYGEDGRPIYSNSFRPVGLVRRQHEEAEVKVKTTAELEAEERQSSDDEELFVAQTAKGLADIGIEDGSEVWHAAPKSLVKVKSEPGTEPDTMDIDIADIPEAVKAPPSPEVKKKPIISEDVAAIAKRRKEKADKDPEFGETASNLIAQLEELRFYPTDDGDDHQSQEKDDHIYLFQLPPILPPLAKPTDGANGDAAATGPISQANSNIPTANKVKVEEGAEKEKESNPFSTLPPEGGLIGKLNVRQSGKVELDWGGTILNLGMVAPTEFLTSAIMIEQNIDLQNPEKSTGFACGIGEVERKFVLAPIWDEEEDWDPSLDGIDGLDQ
ncbi:RNA polymerase III RPC4-domain-containing protein [Hypoxylon cercidicola]|nr:RNA polymerase III RPC4-domain-containing protein [Hypoxylon cercidicola]